MDDTVAVQVGPNDGERAVRDRVREGVTMALYVSLSLLAVLLALPSGVAGTIVHPALEIVLASVGLILAHALAFRISTRLTHKGELSVEALEQLGAQLAGGAVVTVVAVIPVLLFGGERGVAATELVLVAFVAAVAYLAAREGSKSHAHALGYVIGVVGVSVAVLAIKAYAGH